MRQKAQQGKLRLTLADAARTAYAAASKKVLEGVYDAVRDEFVRLYRLINQEDEGTFSASLEPSAAKLSFGVDFYGKGQHPPGAYHSEGHQDGMGLCLYLALMKYLFKNQFALAVLDDVVMSVDTGHRKHVCTVLQTEFRDTQFILTTHDRVWLAHMKSEGLIKQEGGATHFKTWNVETGPRRWDDRDTFTRIREELAGGNVREAAGILRPDLEYVAAELCEGLRAEVVYVQDGRHDLGMLLNPAAGRFKKLLNRALASAESWNKEDLAKVIRQRKAAFEIAYSKTKAEEWQTNALIHFNTWQNLEAKEFKSVADAFEALLKTFQCQDCNSLLFVTHQGFDEQDLRCNCGRITWNLVRKPAEGAR